MSCGRPARACKKALDYSAIEEQDEEAATITVESCNEFDQLSIQVQLQ